MVCWYVVFCIADHQLKKGCGPMQSDTADGKCISVITIERKRGLQDGKKLCLQ